MYIFICMQHAAISLSTLDPHPPPASFPRAEVPVNAGFPSPAEDYLEERIDLNRELVRNPTATFLARVRGASMRDAGLEEGDLVLIDRSRTPRNGSMVLAWVDGGFTVKTLRFQSGRVWLSPANPAFPDMELCEEEEARIWGVVTHVVKCCA
ncbi:MAG: translesion error-prone DNA polymerase V autoproteolytic subunit [Kiritimatiellae bacterium]|nr:translesion error-prone DNA polymerase V autoproteolytic subunit [Kiritimatiellia bacterium]